MPEIGGDEMPAIFSINNAFNENFDDRRIRMPNHLMAVKWSTPLSELYRKELWRGYRLWFTAERQDQGR